LTARATDNTGATVGSEPIAVSVSPGEAKLYFIGVDHLNTPRLITDGNQQVVWRWDQQEPFGDAAPDQNPSSIGLIEFPLRFAGQYADSETGLHYNFYRDYRPDTASYIESDLIGLMGGLSTYVFVAASPLRYTDFFGLVRTCGTGKIGERFTPNMFYFPCCAEHDDCYDDCKNRPPRESCDREFANCTMRQCSNRWIATKFACEYAAVVYSDLVQWNGRDPYDEARKNCDSCRR
jgi:RHS repeat-associated protein